MRARWRPVPSLAVLSCVLLIPTPSHASVPRVLPESDPGAAASAPADPYSLVVTTTGSTLGSGPRTELEAVSGVEVESVTPLGAGTYEITWQEEPAQDPTALAAEVAAGPAFVSASPNSRIAPLEVAPVDPGDPRFAEQWNLWDSVTPFGGWSLRAPTAWRTQQGSADVVVAVVDTGIVAHPDLQPAVVAGYDLVDDQRYSNDGDGRDPNPSDPGDWVDATDQQDPAFANCGVATSSWHGSHVAGIIAAQAGDSGVAGVAPGVRIQPVRALAKCGGDLADLIAAVNWAAGVPVAGITSDNCDAGRHHQPVARGPRDLPSRLPGRGRCGGGQGDQRGGCSGQLLGPVSGTFPANCTGVTAVAASGRDGSRASYSNYGPGVAITAPGGSGADAILSTVDTGTTVPLGAGYALKSGTSMAAPHVAGALGLVRSAYRDSAAQALARLAGAARAFPTGTVRDCTTATCGAGLLDMNGVLPPPATGGISGRVLRSGAPEALADVAVIPAAAETAGRWYDVSDASGGYQVLGLPAGEYRVLARPRGGSDMYSPGVADWVSSACFAVGGSIVGDRDIELAGVAPGTPVQTQCPTPIPPPTRPRIRPRIRNRRSIRRRPAVRRGRPPLRASPPPATSRWPAPWPRPVWCQLSR